MSAGLFAIPRLPPTGVIPSRAPDAVARFSLVLPATTEPAPNIAHRRLLGILKATELMAEIIAMDGGLDVVR